MSDEWTVVTRAALAPFAPDWRSIERGQSEGRFHQLQHGIWLVGERATGVEGWKQDVAAAAATGGRIAGQTAAALYSLDGFDPGLVPIELNVPRGSAARRPGVRVRRMLEDARTVNRITVTGPAETLVDLAADLRPRPGCAAATKRLDAFDLVELAVECALHNELVTIADLRAIARRAGNRPGAQVLREVLAQRPDELTPTESYLETRGVQVLRDAGLPTFDRQVQIGPYRVDLGRDHVVIEFLGEEWHHDRTSADFQRIRWLQTQEHLVVLPVVFGDVEHRTQGFVGDVRAALATRPT